MLWSFRSTVSHLVLVVGCAMAGAAHAEDALPILLPAKGFQPVETPKKLSVPHDERRQILASAKVWTQPLASVAGVDFRQNAGGADSFKTTDEITCKFLPRKPSVGTTRKFECVFENGEVLKVKYDNREAQTETAASRLLAALGFGTDRVQFVKKVRCFGCPKDPFVILSCLSTPFEKTLQDCTRSYGLKRKPDGNVEVDVNYGSFTDFSPASVERREPGITVEAEGDEGWEWSELTERGDPSRGGATRAERDALRLMAVFLNNWDTKEQNQRLLCRTASQTAVTVCNDAFAYMSDVGAAFGGRARDGIANRKISVDYWADVPIWADPKTCLVKIDSALMLEATFGKATISESGRQLLAGLLTQLSDQQIRDLFETSGFLDYAKGAEANRNLDSWLGTFQDKVRQIADREPCPQP
jgi:hypothetical protein